MSPTQAQSLLLLSGGIDSAALAAMMRPARTLFIDYGQRPAAAEANAARAVAGELGLAHHALSVDASSIGSGLLAGVTEPQGAPSPEWWPYRNQLLVTLAAAWLVKTCGVNELENSKWRIVVGSVRSDGDRHRDGSSEFFTSLDQLLRSQEGQIECAAPALGSSSVELVRESGVGPAVLGWTHSCHVASIPCLDCPGCYKRDEVFAAVWSGPGA